MTERCKKCELRLNGLEVLRHKDLCAACAALLGCEYELVDGHNRTVRAGIVDRGEAERLAAKLGLTVMENWRV